jgi:hypothetical protein
LSKAQFLAAMAIVCSMIADNVSGQFAAGGIQPAIMNSPTVTISKLIEMKLETQKLRLFMRLKAESRDGERALKTLITHQERVTAGLIEMGADEKSIAYSAASVTSGTPGVPNPESARKSIRQQAAQMRALNPQIRGQLGPVIPEDEDSELPIVFSASCSVTADWAFKDGADNKSILLPSKLRSKIGEMDLQGKELVVVLDPIEQQLIQPLLGAVNVNVYYPGSAENTSTDPAFYYVSVMSEEQEEVAIADAFKIVRSKGNALAKAGGGTLGAIRSISTSIQPTADPISVFQAYPGTTSVPKKAPNELLKTDPNAPSPALMLIVVFDLK